MGFFGSAKSYVARKWRYLEDILIIGCIALQHSCNAGDRKTPRAIAGVSVGYLVLKTVYGLIGGFWGDDDKPFSVFDALRTVLVSVHVFVYLLVLVGLHELYRREASARKGLLVDDKALAVTETVYMFMASQSIMSNVESNTILELCRGVLGYLQIVRALKTSDIQDYDELLPWIYPMGLSFFPFLIEGVWPMVSRWLLWNKLSRYTSRIAKAVTVVSAIACTVAAMYGVFSMLNVMANFAVVVVVEQPPRPSTSNEIKNGILDSGRRLGKRAFSGFKNALGLSPKGVVEGSIRKAVLGGN